MEAKAISMYIVPSSLSALPGEFTFYVSVIDYEGPSPVKSRTTVQKHVNFPSAGDRDEHEWAIEICDEMYKELTAMYALVKRERDKEVNARPSDTTLP